MNEASNRDHEESDEQGHESPERLQPRPVARPPVDADLAAVFRRPSGVEGSFDRLHASDREQHNGALTAAPPPPESLAEAFGRPAGAENVVLQRPHGQSSAESDGRDGSTHDDGEASLWASSTDPWRDPAASVVLGAPAMVGQDDEPDPEYVQGRLLSLPEVLFGRRVKPTALALLSVVALLVGAAGGLIGWALASTGDSLTGELNLAEAQAGKERAAGSVADIAGRVAPTVVSVEVESPEADSGGVGSGVVVDDEGYVLTNHHVVAQAVEDEELTITAVFVDGNRVEGHIVGTDPKTDLAVLKVDVSDPAVVEIGQSDDLAPGDTVVAVGSPFGLENTVTEGIVSALNRPVTAPGENDDPPVTYDAVQTDAPINPGNSGGALVDSTGALVGINSLIRTVGSEDEGGSIGLGFAIPVDQAISISEELVREGHATHADLGARTASVSAHTSHGAQVQNVAEGGPAAEAGITEGDVITKIGDRRVRNAAEVTVAVREHDIDDVVPVHIARGDRSFTVDVTLQSDD